MFKFDECLKDVDFSKYSVNKEELIELAKMRLRYKLRFRNFKLKKDKTHFKNIIDEYESYSIDAHYYKVDGFRDKKAKYIEVRMERLEDVIRAFKKHLEDRVSPILFEFENNEIDLWYFKPIIFCFLDNYIILGKNNEVIDEETRSYKIDKDEKNKNMSRLIKQNLYLEYYDFELNIDFIKSYCKKYINKYKEYTEEDIYIMDYIIEVLFSKDKFDIIHEEIESLKTKNNGSIIEKRINYSEIGTFLEYTYWLNQPVFKKCFKKFILNGRINEEVENEIVYIQSTVDKLEEKMFFDMMDLIIVDSDCIGLKQGLNLEYEIGNLSEELRKNEISIRRIVEQIDLFETIIGYFDDFMFIEYANVDEFDFNSHLKHTLVISDIPEKYKDYITNIFKVIKDEYITLTQKLEIEALDEESKNLTTRAYIFEKFKETIESVELSMDLLDVEYLLSEIKNIVSKIQESEKRRKIESKIKRLFKVIDDKIAHVLLALIYSYFLKMNVTQKSLREIQKDIDLLELLTYKYFGYPEKQLLDNINILLKQLDLDIKTSEKFIMINQIESEILILNEGNFIYNEILNIKKSFIEKINRDIDENLLRDSYLYFYKSNGLKKDSEAYEIIKNKKYNQNHNYNENQNSQKSIFLDNMIKLIENGNLIDEDEKNYILDKLYLCERFFERYNTSIIDSFDSEDELYDDFFKTIEDRKFDIDFMTLGKIKICKNDILFKQGKTKR